MPTSRNNSNATELTPERIAWSDPCLRQFARIKISPALVGALFYVVFQGIRALVTWQTGHFRTTGTVAGFFEDPGLYTQAIVVSTIVAYYIWLPRGIVTLFKGLHTNGVLQETKESDYSSFIEKMQKSFGRPWWSALPLTAAIGTVLIVYLPQLLTMAPSAWWAADAVNRSLTLLWMIVIVYFVLSILVYVVLSIYWLHRLFDHFAVLIRPLYPDRAGGLSPLGDFTLKLSYLIAAVGAILVVTPITRNYVIMGTLQFRWTTELILALGAYIMGAPIVFFAPLSVAHNSMKDAKDQFLLQIAQRFDEEYSVIQNFLIKAPSSLEDSSKILEDTSEVLKGLQDLYDMTSKFPVWPFNVTNITRFGTSYISPIALAILTELIARMF
jgi:hypothetical protein